MAEKSQPKPVIIMSAALVGLDVLTAGIGIVPGMAAWIVSLCVLVVAAVTAGWASYVHSQVTPYRKVAARRLPSGKVVAGPAAPGLTKEGEPVDVTSREIGGF